MCVCCICSQVRQTKQRTKPEIRTEQHSEFSEDAEKGQGDSLYLVVGSITIGYTLVVTATLTDYASFVHVSSVVENEKNVTLFFWSLQSVTDKVRRPYWHGFL